MPNQNDANRGAARIAFCQKIQRQEAYSLYQPSSAEAMFRPNTTFITYPAMAIGQYRCGRLTKIKPPTSGMKTPDPTPAHASSTRNKPRFGASGSNSSASPKSVHPASNTRRGVKTKPSHTAIGPIIICAAEKAVIIHAPSSTPTPSPPRTSANPAEFKRPVSVAAMALMTIAATPSHGRGVGLTVGCCETGVVSLVMGLATRWASKATHREPVQPAFLARVRFYPNRHPEP